MYICPLDDHLLLTLGYDSVLLQSTSEIFFKQRNQYHTLLKKKKTLNFLLLSFSTKEEDNIQNFKGRSKFTRVPKLCPPPPFFFQSKSAIFIEYCPKVFSRLVFKRYILINTELLYLFLEIN